MRDTTPGRTSRALATERSGTRQGQGGPGRPAALKTPAGDADQVRVAAESGERRAARLREATDRDPTGSQGRLAAARRIEQGNAGERRVAHLLDVLDGAG